MASDVYTSDPGGALLAWPEPAWVLDIIGILGHAVTEQGEKLCDSFQPTPKIADS